MEQTVYADLLFLINFSMDFLCVFLTARLLSAPFSLPRALLAAVLGGFYAVIGLVIPTNPWHWLWDVVFCLLMCAVAFFTPREGVRRLLLFTAVFFLTSMLLGGIMTAVFNLMNRSVPPSGTAPDETDVPLWLFALLSLLAWGVTWVGGRFLRRRAQIPEARLEITLGNRRTVIRALCDSGNLLTDSLSGKPVIVADTRVAASLLPADCDPSFLKQTDGLSHVPPPLAPRIRLIPASSVGYGGLIPALRPDRIVVWTGTRRREADALVGFADLPAVPNGVCAILPPDILT